MRIGQGIDVHAFAADRKLVIGGVEIPHHKGLAGHSDADVLLHAICDALLGAGRSATSAGTIRTAIRNTRISTAAGCCARSPPR